MVRLIVFISLCCLTLTTYSQSNENEIKYVSKSMHLKVVDKNFKEVSLVPMSDFVGIVYNKFYKSYVIVPVMEDGIGEIKLSYLKKEADGSIRTVDKDGAIHYVFDDLATNGTLRILKMTAL